MKKLVSLAAGLSLLAFGARADLTIDALGAASAVSPTDVFPVYQGSNPAKGATAAQVKTYIGGISCPTGFTASGGSCIWTQTASSSPFLEWTPLTGSEYELKCHGVIVASGSPEVGIQFGTAGGYHNGATDYERVGVLQSNGSSIAFNGNYQAGIPFVPTNSGTRGFSYDVSLHDLSSTTLTKTMEGFSSYISGGFYTVSEAASSDIATGAATNAVTKVRVFDLTGGNLTSGICSLYWLAN